MRNRPWRASSWARPQTKHTPRSSALGRVRRADAGPRARCQGSGKPTSRDALARHRHRDGAAVDERRSRRVQARGDDLAPPNPSHEPEIDSDMTDTMTLRPTPTSTTSADATSVAAAADPSAGSILALLGIAQSMLIID